MSDLHRLPIRITGHAAERIALRLRLGEADLIRLVKSARIVRRAGRPGKTGVLQSGFGAQAIRFVYTTRKGHLVILTVTRRRR